MSVSILYTDRDLAVCLKPRGVSSEQGGLPELLAAQLGQERLWCVHRLDAAVGGVMVYARSARAAAVPAASAPKLLASVTMPARLVPIRPSDP